MKQKLNIKQKLYLLSFSFILALIFVYTFAISSTKDLGDQCAELNQKIEALKNAPLEIKDIESKLKKVNMVLGQSNEERTDFHNELLSFLSVNCQPEDIVIRDFPRPHIFETKEYVVETNKMTLEGDYKKLVQLIQKLEKPGMKGHIMSVKFETEPNHRNGIYKLNLTVYEQNIYDKH